MRHIILCALCVHWIPKSVTDTAILNLPRGALSIHRGIKPPPHHISLRTAHRHVHFCRASSLSYIGNEWQLATSVTRFAFGVNPGLGGSQPFTLNGTKIVSSSYLAIESCHHHHPCPSECLFFSLRWVMQTDVQFINL